MPSPGAFPLPAPHAGTLAHLDIAVAPWSSAKSLGNMAALPPIPLK